MAKQQTRKLVLACQGYYPYNIKRQSSKENPRPSEFVVFEEVCAAHIKLYVNSFSLDLGSEGEAAITTLLSRAEAAGLVPRSTEDIFISRT